MSTKRSALWHAAICLSGLLLTGWLTVPLIPAAAKAKVSVIDSENAPASLGPRAWGGEWSELGADLLWVSAYRDWERKDLPALRRTLNQVVELNPRAVHFWVNGARMLGYDASVWRERRADGIGRAQIRREQMNEAIHYLHRGRQANPARFEFGVEEAVLRLKLDDDLAGAVVALEQLESKSGVPYYVGRVRGELLIQLGRTREALGWLRRFEQTLPDHDPAARREVVWERIQELERIVVESD